MDLKSKNAYLKIQNLTHNEDERQELFLAFMEDELVDLTTVLGKIRQEEELYIKGKSVDHQIINNSFESTVSEKVLSVMYLAMLGYNIVETCDILEISPYEVEQSLEVDLTKRWYTLWHSNVVYMNMSDSDSRTKKSRSQKNTCENIKQKVLYLNQRR
jgi:hypothetical protein